MEFLAVILYFLPTVVAFCHNSEKTAAIGALNLLLGWTLVGWVLALVWALADKK